MRKSYLLIALILLLIGVVSSAGVWRIPTGTAEAHMMLPIPAGGSNSSGSESSCTTAGSDDFSSDNLAANYTQDAGVWTVGSGVLSVTSTNGHILYTADQAGSATQWAKVTVSNEYEKRVGVILRASGSTGYRYVIDFRQGSGTTWRVYNGTTWDEEPQTDATVTWGYNETVGVAVTGTGNDTVISVWDTPVGDTPCDWGDATFTMTNNPTNPANTGQYVGLWSESSSEVSFDNFSFGTLP